MEGPNEFELSSLPSDGITNIVFAPTSPSFLFASSWDKSVRLYDVNSNVLRVQYHHSAAVLDCTFSDEVHGFSGGLDKFLKMFDFNTNTDTVLGAHRDAIQCVNHCPAIGFICSGSWDKTVKLWDIRGNRGAVGTLDQQEKVYTMDVSQEKLIVGTKARRVLIWDLRNTVSMLANTKTETGRERTDGQMDKGTSGDT
jgi:cell cycle arrest protein BUB3